MTRGARLCVAHGIALVLMISASRPWAGEAAAVAANPELESRAQRVAEELRCLVCQNQTIADSNAELAKDLRAEVRRMLEQGKSDAEVREFMVTRYGDFILYRPPWKATTLLLWSGPFVLLLVAALVHRRTVARRENGHETSVLTDAEQARLRALTGAREGPGQG